MLLLYIHCYVVISVKITIPLLLIYLNYYYCCCCCFCIISQSHSPTLTRWQPVSYENASVTGMGAGQQGKFMLLPGQWTDDTSMGLCIADSILSNAGESARIQHGKVNTIMQMRDIQDQIILIYYCKFYQRIFFIQNNFNKISTTLNAIFVYFIFQNSIVSL